MKKYYNGKRVSFVESIRHIIGAEYVQTKQFENEENALVADAFEKIKKVNKFLFEQIPFEVIFTDDDIYSSAEEMRRRVIEENVIYIYKGYSGHPYLNEMENCIGRAVHDVYAHLVCGCPFTFLGEYSGFLEQSKYYPPECFAVLFAEIPAQTCAYYYMGDFSFEQRAFAAPEKWIELTAGLERDYSQNSVMKPFEKFYQNGGVTL